MTRVSGRRPPRPQPEANQTVARGIGIAQVALLVAVLCGLGLFTATRAGVSWWFGVAFAACIGLLWYCWWLLRPRLGSLTAGAAVTLGGFVLGAVAYTIPTNCPSSLEPVGRCGSSELAQGGLIGLLTAGMIMVGIIGASTSWRAAVGSTRTILRHLRRRRRDPRRRHHLNAPWRGAKNWVRSPILWSGLTGSVVAGTWRWMSGGSWTQVLIWAAGGLLAAGGIPAAWRSGGADTRR